MSNISYLSKEILPQKINDKTDCSDRYVMFYDKDIHHAGKIKYECNINEGQVVYAVELNDDIISGTNGTFNEKPIFECNSKQGVLIDKREKFFDLDMDTDFIIEKTIDDIIEEKGKYCNGDHVDILVKSESRSGTVVRAGRIDGFFCYAVNMDIVKPPIKKNPCIVIADAISANKGDKSRKSHLDMDTDFIIEKTIDDIIEEKGEYCNGDHVNISVKSESRSGTVVRAGRIDGCFCYAVNMDIVKPPIKKNPCIVIADAISANKGDKSRKSYVYPRYELLAGDKRGIQGNLNSCYLDTSLFAIFTFNMFLDNMLYDKCEDETIKELQKILRDEIIHPLRRDGYVDYTSVSKFRDKLQSLSPAGRFVINERDPEEFLEQLFKLITPKKYLLKTSPLNDMANVQHCFLTQIFYESDVVKDHIGLEEMFTLSFLEFQMLIEMPPKCLILQLPRNGKDLKKFKRVIIPKKLDITQFILKCIKQCSYCSTTAMDMFLCQKCSMSEKKLKYSCTDHKENCAHEKVHIPKDGTPYYGNVELDLVSILCIEKNHYVTYVKTNNVIPRWIYFNSMEKIEKGIFSPAVRDTKLQQYFDNGKKSHNEYDIDIEKIENYAFICVYKNSTLEFYKHDFNSTS